jgi:hypothetical protein
MADNSCSCGAIVSQILNLYKYINNLNQYDINKIHFVYIMSACREKGLQAQNVMTRCCCCSSRWSETVSELRPPTGLLFISQMIYEYKEPRWNDTDRGKPKNSGKKRIPVPLCPPQILYGVTRAWNPGLCSERPETNRLSHGTAFHCVRFNRSTDGTRVALKQQTIKHSSMALYQILSRRTNRREWDSQGI